MGKRTDFNANRFKVGRWILGVCLTISGPSVGLAVRAQSAAIQKSPACAESLFSIGGGHRTSTMYKPDKFADFNHLADITDRLAPLSYVPKGPNLKMMLGAIEVGRVPGIKSTDGKPLNQSVGGIGTVMNDTWTAKAPLLAERGIETIAVTPLMRNISKVGMTYIGKVQARVDGALWDVNVYEYKMPSGGRILFLENEHFTQRLDAIPSPGENIYVMRDLPPGQEGELEKQRIWSALNQATAKVYSLVGADFYIPQDGHLAVASYYIHREGPQPLSLSPVLHNERYLDSFYTEPQLRPQSARVWDVSLNDLNEYFMHGDHVVMPAAAIRTAERTGVFTAKSVADNTANTLNRDGLPKESYPQIELFSRLAPEQNFLAESNRPDFNVNLAPATKEELAAESIADSEVVQNFATLHGYQFGGRLENEGLNVITGKARAKRAVQKIFGLDVNPNRPLFVSFARLVEQKGMDFLVPNVMRILERGGQLVVGGPVGDASGQTTQAAFKALKAKLLQQRPDLARNFYVIEGNVMGRKKGLLLAGHDFFPVPSRFEPCGLTDVESLFMGGLPIAPRIGGLVKGENTILYLTKNPNDQAADLGWGIDQAFDMYENQHELFLRHQIAANREDFSLSKHVEQALRNQRVEVYYRMIRLLDKMVTEGTTTNEVAQDVIRHRIFERYPNDRAYLIESLSHIHASRRSYLVNWVALQ